MDCHYRPPDCPACPLDGDTPAWDTACPWAGDCRAAAHEHRHRHVVGGERYPVPDADAAADACPDRDGPA